MTNQPTPAAMTGDPIADEIAALPSDVADTVADRAWRVCGHRADYGSRWEHARDCPGTLADHGVTAQPDDTRR